MEGLDIELKFRIPVKLTKKRKWYVASCPVLDVASQGETEKKARDNLVEALTLFLTTCIDIGTLNDVLKQSGFKTVEAKRLKTKEKDYINIPLYLLANHAGSKTCHV
jgi:predicted RNase H-like HicB family nuclease